MKLADFRPTKARVTQFAEYMVGGATYFWSGYIVFAICYSGLGWSWLPAKMLADIVGWALNYLIQRYWAFRSPGLKHHEARSVSKYTAVTILNLGLDYLIIWGLNEVGISPYIGFFISAGFFTLWNYLWYKFWVFRTTNVKTNNNHNETNVS